MPTSLRYPFQLLNVLILCSVVVRNRLVYKLKSECVCFLDERFYVQRRRRLRKGGYGSAYLALKKELREANLQSLLGGSSRFTSPTSIDSDPLLSSLMFSSPSSKSATPVVEGTSATKASHKASLKKYNNVYISANNRELLSQFDILAFCFV